MAENNCLGESLACLLFFLEVWKKWEGVMFDSLFIAFQRELMLELVNHVFDHSAVPMYSIIEPSRISCRRLTGASRLQYPAGARYRRV